LRPSCGAFFAIPVIRENLAGAPAGAGTTTGAGVTAGTVSAPRTSCGNAKKKARQSIAAQDRVKIFRPGRIACSKRTSSCECSIGLQSRSRASDRAAAGFASPLNNIDTGPAPDGFHRGPAKPVPLERTAEAITITLDCATLESDSIYSPYWENVVRGGEPCSFVKEGGPHRFEELEGVGPHAVRQQALLTQRARTSVNSLGCRNCRRRGRENFISKPERGEPNALIDRRAGIFARTSAASSPIVVRREGSPTRTYPWHWRAVALFFGVAGRPTAVLWHACRNALQPFSSLVCGAVS
jgi:hypothetical protein